MPDDDDRRHVLCPIAIRLIGDVMTFALILTVLNAAGLESSFVIDYNLSKIDCQVLWYEWSTTLDEYSYVTCEVEPN